MISEVATRIGEDKMIQQGNAEKVRAVLQPDRKLTIFFTGRRIIGRVIMRTCDVKSR